ncbi:MAG TPA: hypothetical protein VIL84_08535 [Devosiaceae bacterium]
MTAPRTQTSVFGPVGIMFGDYGRVREPFADNERFGEAGRGARRVVSAAAR